MNAPQASSWQSAVGRSDCSGVELGGRHAQPPLIELSDVSVVRDGKTVLHRLNLTFREGEHTAVIGPNGCGKSTLIKLLTRELHPYAGIGSVKVLGRELWLLRELRTVLGVVSGEPKEPLLGEPTALDVAISGLLGTYGVLWGYEVTPEMAGLGRLALASLDAAHLADRRVETLSAGEYRRTFIARALVSDPRALVLDEPTTSLDLKSAHDFYDAMGRIAGRKTLILVTHHLEEIVPEIQRVVLMRSGRIIADGSPEQVLTDHHLSEAFGAKIRLVSRDPYKAVVQ